VHVHAIALAMPGCSIYDRLPVKQSAGADRQGPAAQPERARPRTPGAPARSAGPTPSQALYLQSAAGNRVAARVLARWSKHPDEAEKGKLLSDEAAADFLHFNIPLGK